MLHLARASCPVLALTALLLAVVIGPLRLTAQVESGQLLLSPTATPADVRSLADGRALILYRDAFRGYAPAGASRIELRAANGAVQFERRPGLDVPDATIITVLDTTLSKNGQIVVSMAAVRPGAAAAHILAYYSSSPETTIRLVIPPVACVRLAPANDQGLWCLGPNVERHNSGNPDFQFLHHFSEDGRLLGSAGDRKAFPRAPWAGKSQLVAKDDQILVWMATLGELVTFSATGEIVQRLAVPAPPFIEESRTEYMLSTGGELFALGVVVQPTQAIDSWRRSLFTLSDGPRWKNTEIAAASLAFRLVGASRGTVTMWDRHDSRLVRLRP